MVDGFEDKPMIYAENIPVVVTIDELHALRDKAIECRASSHSKCQKNWNSGTGRCDWEVAYFKMLNAIQENDRNCWQVAKAKMRKISNQIRRMRENVQC